MRRVVDGRENRSRLPVIVQQKMKILLLTQWYLPEPQLISDLAETLRDAGHEVTVLTGFPNFPSGRIYPGYRIRLFQKEQINGVPVIRVPLYPDHSRSAVKRSLNILSFAFCAAVLGPWLVPRVDVIHVVHPPLTIGLPAWVLSRLQRGPFTYEIKDMWPETLRATGMVNNGRMLRWIGRFAKWVYRRAAAIRVISPGFRANLIEKGVPEEKIRVISNWVDTDYYRQVAPDSELAREHGLADRFNVMFAGMIGPAQGMEVVLDAAALLHDLPDVQFVLLGDGNDLERLKGTAQERNLSNVKFLGRHPPNTMNSFYALADVLLIHLRDDPLFRITIPHKTFTYMAAAKPILAAVEGNVADLIRNAHAGVTCPPSNPAAMADAVRRLREMPIAKREKLGYNGRKVACEEFNRTGLVQELSQMLTSMTNTHKAAHQRYGNRWFRLFWSR